jgi:ABC-2 type transport system ATP-binding protein
VPQPANLVASESTVISVSGLVHDYEDRRALDGISLEVSAGEVYGLLGPNGGGKTTLFKILSTHLKPQAGSVHVFGHDAAREAPAIRAQIGVVFQRPSLDPKLSVFENLFHHGLFYGLHGSTLRDLAVEAASRLDLEDRLSDRVEKLSGGLQRRVELAKALLPEPGLLVFDEPSTGLDPGARRRLWDDLQCLREERGVTVVLTTHFLEEAERCDRIGILAGGRMIAEGDPGDLKRSVGGDVMVIQTHSPGDVSEKLKAEMQLTPEVLDGQVRITVERGEELVSDVYRCLGELVASLTLGHPTLEDVFVAHTGQRFEIGDDDAEK